MIGLAETVVRVNIVGLPKTGTTGLYRKVQTSLARSGQEFVSLFEPKGPKLWDAFFRRARPDIGMVTKVMLKPKYFNSDSISHFDKRVMLVRDPRDRMISAFLFRALSRPRQAEPYVDEFIRLLKVKEDDPSSISFLDLMAAVDDIGLGGFDLDKVVEQLDFQIEIIEKHRYFKMKYEDFVADELSQLSSYLSLPLEGDSKQTSWLKHIERSKAAGEWRQWFTNKDIEYLNPRLQPVMTELGYEDDWSVPEDQVIDPANSSEYIDRNFKRRKQQMEMAAKSDALPATREDFDTILDRAADGRLESIRLAAHIFEEGAEFQPRNAIEALNLYQVGLIIGDRECREAAKRLVDQGVTLDVEYTDIFAKWREQR